MGPKRVVVFPFVICLEESCIIVYQSMFDERKRRIGDILCYYKSCCPFPHNVMCFLQNSEFPGSQSEATGAGATLCWGWAELTTARARLASGHQGAATQGATLLREKLSSQQVPRERLAVAREACQTLSEA